MTAYIVAQPTPLTVEADDLRGVWYALARHFGELADAEALNVSPPNDTGTGVPAGAFTVTAPSVVDTAPASVPATPEGA